MPFPNPPFKLGTDDSELIRYLCHDGGSDFRWLRTASRQAILQLKDAEALSKKHDVLTGLWSMILQDALLALKKNDTREWDKKRSGITYESFFDPTSLGLTDLEKLLKSFSDFESLLYGASPGRYRDHVVHVFRVWITGHGLLRHALQHGLHADKICCAKGRTISPEEWECMWALTALCHDLGYPLQSIGDINKRARDALSKLELLPSGELQFLFSQQMLPFNDTIIKLVSSKPVRMPGRNKYITHLQNKYYLKFLKSFDKLQHGVVSSVLVSRALVYFLESDFCHDHAAPLNAEDMRQFVIRREILRAIAAHTCPDVYHLRFDTLSFLLYVVDELQCWDRPTLEQYQGRSSDTDKAEAGVRSFGRDRMAVEIHTGEATLAEVQQHVTDKLNYLHQILRLAVGTPQLPPKQRLRFTYTARDKSKAFLALEKGRIRKSPPDWFEK